MIDYELKTTGRKNLTWIGHSQGTSQMFAALSTNEDKYANKINLFVALAPIARMKDVKGAAIMADSDVSTALVEAAMKLGVLEIFGPTWTDNYKFVCTMFPCEKLSAP